MENERRIHNDHNARKIKMQPSEPQSIKKQQNTSVTRSGDEIRSATVMVLGAPMTGKSSLISHLVGNRRSKKRHTMKIREGGRTRFKIHFISPPFSDMQSSWSSAVKSQVYKADAFLLIYAVNSRESLDIAIKYREKIEDLIGNVFPVLLLSNKVDLKTGRIVTPAEADLRALHWDMPVLEVSAKTADGISELKRKIYQMVNFPRRLYMRRFMGIIPYSA